MSSINKFIYYIGVIALMIMGIVCLISPTFLPSLFDVDININGQINGPMQNEVRAVYGTFGLYLGLILVIVDLKLLNFSLEVRRGIVLCIGGSLLSMSMGRIISVLVDGIFLNWLTLAVFINEIFFGTFYILHKPSI
eukprot:TRINITY_DN12146_c0_g1_i1.p1 TRINITY_DN12146_c0_g1~~TRINITY_DN12146_c0_g1_i1.p1  ORF type:complete len:137 (+),score=15.41 TRINITY_DN12146_c0_g1_i1:37-447(+)